MLQIISINHNVSYQIKSAKIVTILNYIIIDLTSFGAEMIFNLLDENVIVNYSVPITFLVHLRIRVYRSLHQQLI